MDWLRRNRRRLAVGGGVLGGLYIVGRFETSKEVWLLKYWLSQAGWAATCKDTGGRDGTAGKGWKTILNLLFIANHQVERTRKANQFSATESTCRHTLASLMPTLLTQVRENLNTEAVTTLLRSKPGPEEKLKLWERLKVTFLSWIVMWPRLAGAGHITVPGSHSGQCFSRCNASHTTQRPCRRTLSTGVYLNGVPHYLICIVLSHL